MGFLENFQDIFSVAGQKAKKTYDIKVLTHKIKGYEKEIRDCYVEIGKALHQSKKENAPLDDSFVDSIFENINSMAYRINLLSKQIETLKKQAGAPAKSSRREPPRQETGDPSASDMIEEKYFKLSLKDDDLKIRRTVEGIKAVRVCPSCAASNDPSAEICSNCGEKLRSK